MGGQLSACRPRAGPGDGRVGRAAAAHRASSCSRLVAAGVRVPGRLARAGDRLADPLRGGDRRLVRRRRAGADRRLRDRSRRDASASTCRRSPSSTARGRCRSTSAAAATRAAATGPTAAWSTRSDAGLPVTAFVHVVDCREGGARPARGRLLGGARPATSTSSTGPTTPTRRPCAASRSPEPGAIIATTGSRSSSGSAPTARSTSAPPPTMATTTRRGSPTPARTPASAPCGTSPKTVGARPRNGWGPASGLLFVSGGSHAGNVDAFRTIDRLTPGRRVHLVPLEPVAAEGRHAASRSALPGTSGSGSTPRRGRPIEGVSRACR